MKFYKRGSFKLIASYLLICILTCFLVEIDILWEKLSEFIFLFVVAGFPFWLFVIGIQWLYEESNR